MLPVHLPTATLSMLTNQSIDFRRTQFQFVIHWIHWIPLGRSCWRTKKSEGRFQVTRFCHVTRVELSRLFCQNRKVQKFVPKIAENSLAKFVKLTLLAATHSLQIQVPLKLKMKFSEWLRGEVRTRELANWWIGTSSQPGRWLVVDH